jgi:Protein of unknown function (DUF664)
LLWKLEGLPEYDARRPLTPTSPNLLGLVKHLAVWEFRYFGEVFGRRRGHVPWWGGAEVTLHRSMLHVVVETQRHAGHADIVPELIDGDTGLLPGNHNMPAFDEAGWADRWNQLEQATRAARR